MKTSYQPTAPSPPAPRCAAFTLIELLVVIAIIAILASMLVPALGKAKQKSQGIQCMNNHRQLMLALRCYTDDNGDEFPGALDWQPPGARTSLPDWTGGSFLTLDDPRFQGNWDPSSIRDQSVLAGYTHRSVAIWRCPGDLSTAINNKGQRVSRVRSMSMNCWVGGPGETVPASPPALRGWRVFLRMSDLHDPGPARTYVFLDERADSINNGHFGQIMTGYPDKPNLWQIVNWPASYHNKAGGLSFADGHSEIRKWRDARTTVPIGKRDIGLVYRPMPNNPDVFWMMDRSTRMSE
jgi:prepilin-type N-terminal cleavage/methylation domain-containing protein